MTVHCKWVKSATCEVNYAEQHLDIFTKIDSNILTRSNDISNGDDVVS